MSNVNAVVGSRCPTFPVERYAVELLNSVTSPVLSSRLDLISENLNQVIEYYEASNFVDNSLFFVLDTLSSTLTITKTILRYKTVNRKFVVSNIVTILRYIADSYSFDEHPEFQSVVPSDVPRETTKPEPKPKRPAKKV